MVGLGSRGRKPYLLARIDDELVIYEVFPFFQQSQSVVPHHLKIRLRKVPIDLTLRDRKKVPGVKTLRPRSWTRLMRPFTNISGYEGVFISGTFPHWFFVTSRGIPRLHPMNIDGGVTCFTSFNNINCPTGFLYFNREGDLRVSVLPTHLSYDNPWPIRKIPLRCTPHFIVYHPHAKIYAVAQSTEEVVAEYVRQTGEDRAFEPQQKDIRFVWPTVDKFNISFYSPLNWDPIPNTKVELENWENITCMRHVSMRDAGTVSGLKGYIVVGTTNCFGEECTSRGRILILDLVEVVPEPGQPLTKNKVKTIYDKEQKGPVTAMANMNGYLVANIGQRIILFELKSEDLVGIAFIDTQIYIHTINVVKNFILYGDITKSVAIIRYSAEHKNLSLVARDVKPCEVYSAEFLVDNSSLAFVVSDSLQNINVFMYQPEAKESAGGQRLVKRADVNLGSHVTAFWRIRCRMSDALTQEKKISVQFERRHLTMFATLDGSIGQLLPVSEKVYRRLLMLQNVLNQNTPHLAGLNPKNFRTVKFSERSLQNPNRNVLDGELLASFIYMSSEERVEACRRIGTTVDQILDDLMEIDRVSNHF